MEKMIRLEYLGVYGNGVVMVADWENILILVLHPDLEFNKEPCTNCRVHLDLLWMHQVVYCCGGQWKQLTNFNFRFKLLSEI